MHVLLIQTVLYFCGIHMHGVSQLMIESLLLPLLSKQYAHRNYVISNNLERFRVCRRMRVGCMQICHFNTCKFHILAVLESSPHAPKWPLHFKSSQDYVHYQIQYYL